MNYRQFLEWQIYADVEPFDEQRADWRTAMIMALIAEVNRDPEKKPEPFEAKDFLPLFGDTEAPKSKKKHMTIEQLDQMFRMYSGAFLG